MIDSPHLLIAAHASFSDFEWLRALRLRRVWRMDVTTKEEGDRSDNDP